METTALREYREAERSGFIKRCPDCGSLHVVSDWEIAKNKVEEENTCNECAFEWTSDVWWEVKEK